MSSQVTSQVASQNNNDNMTVKDELDVFIVFIYKTSGSVSFTEHFANWLLLQQYDWESLLYDIDVIQADQSNVYIFLRQHQRQNLFELICKKYMDNDQQIIRECICSNYLIQNTVKHRLKEFGIKGSKIYCDRCYKVCQENELIFYCMNKSIKHPNGYDICSQCAIQHTNPASNEKIVSLQKLGFKITEICQVLRELNGDYDAASMFLTKQRQRIIHKEREIEQFYNAGSQDIQQLEHYEIIPIKQNEEDKEPEGTEKNKAVNDKAASDEIEDVPINESKCDIEDCFYLETVTFALNNIDEEHEVASILDAFLHLMDVHHNDQDFEFIVNRLIFCDWNKCNIFRRHHRDRNKLILNRINFRDEIMDKIHCYYLHSFDIGHRIRIDDQMKIIDESKNLTNKKMQHFLYEKRESLRNKNIYTTKSKFNQIEMSQINYKSYYSFGVEFQYIDDQNITDHESKDNDNRVKPLFITKSKYSSIKEEVTMNNIQRMNISQFDNEYGKAQTYYNTLYRKSKYHDMTMDEILSLMIYSNYDLLQYEFSKTYRKINGENDDDLIKRHENFYFFGKNLKSAVNTFGNISKYRLYHGISKKMVFPAYLMNVVINSPLSTTSSYFVASNFANKNGLIIQFEAAESYSDKSGKDLCLSFQMEWLSDFSNEKEHLFIQCDGIFRIANIYDTMSGNEYEVILNALNIIDSPCLTWKDDFDDSKRILVQTIIQHQLSRKLACFQPFKSLDKYSQDIINVYCHNKTYCEISCGNSVFIKEFKLRDHLWINLRLIHILFPNIQFIHLRDVSLCKFSVEYLFKYLQQNRTKQSNLKIIWIKPMVNTDWNILDVIHGYKQQFEALKFSMKKIKIDGYHNKTAYYLLIQKIGSNAKFISGKNILNQPKFEKLLYSNYNPSKNISTSFSGTLGTIWCLK